MSCTLFLNIVKWVRAHSEAGSLPNLTLRLDRLDEVHHFDGARCAVEALVASLRASTLNCLLDGVGGYHAEEYRHTGLQANLSNTLPDSAIFWATSGISNAPGTHAMSTSSSLTS